MKRHKARMRRVEMMGFEMKHAETEVAIPYAVSAGVLPFASTRQKMLFCFSVSICLP